MRALRLQAPFFSGHVNANTNKTGNFTTYKIFSSIFIIMVNVASFLSANSKSIHHIFHVSCDPNVHAAQQSTATYYYFHIIFSFIVFSDLSHVLKLKTLLLMPQSSIKNKVQAAQTLHLINFFSQSWFVKKMIYKHMHQSHALLYRR